MEALENYKGEIYAYKYDGVMVRVEDTGFSMWMSHMGMSIFSPHNSKVHFDTLEEAARFIDLEKNYA